MADLISLVQALPQELYDEIHTLTFAPIHGEHYIDRNYKPPSCLQVSRYTRWLLRLSYYGRDSIFYATKADCEKWMTSLPKANGGTIGVHAEVRILDMIVRPDRPITDIHLLALIDRRRAEWTYSGARDLQRKFFGSFKVKIIEGPGVEYWLSAEDVLHR